MDFQEWYEAFCDETEKLGYTYAIDPAPFHGDFKKGVNPKQSAKEFVEYMNG